MLTGQASWTQAGCCGGQMCEMKTEETETDGDKCDKCEGAGHTETGWIVVITGQRPSGKT